MAVRKPRGAILFGLIVLGGGACGVLLGRARVEEGRCPLVPTKFDRSSHFLGLTYRSLSPQRGKPHLARDLPTSFDRPCYYVMKSADKQVLLVMNLSTKPRLCVDTDGDGVLSEEQCYAAVDIRKWMATSNSWRFGPILLASEEGASETGGSFYVECYRGDVLGPLALFPAFFRTGKVRLAGRTYPVAVVDGDYDGRFSSFLSLPLDSGRRPVVDGFAIDLNRNGKFVNLEMPRQGHSEIMPLSHLVRVADTYYTIDVSSHGTSLTLSKTEPPLGTLVVEPGDIAVELKLWSEAASQGLPPGRQWQLPADRYAGVYAGLEKKDASGNVWTLSGGLGSAAGDLGALNSFVIRPGETTSIKLGPPFVVKTDVQRHGAGLVTIGLVLTGCAGEQYRPDFQRNHKRAPQRTFKIVDEKGNMLVADKFQYG